MKMEVIENQNGKPATVAELIELLKQVPDQNAVVWFFEEDTVFQVNRIEYYPEDNSVCVCGEEYERENLFAVLDIF